MDNLVSLLNAPGAANADVRGKILELVQLWASAFEGKSELSYVNTVYNQLKRDGFDFPPMTKITSSFVDSSAVSLSEFQRGSRLIITLATGMDRLRRLHALSDTVHFHKQEASLPQLWKRFLRSLFFKVDSTATSRYRTTSSRL